MQECALAYPEPHETNAFAPKRASRWRFRLHVHVQSPFKKMIEPGDSHGLACARRLRELGRPVVFASIFPAEQETLDLEPAAYFVKPFALAELEHALESALAQPARA